MNNTAIIDRQKAMLAAGRCETCGKTRGRSKRHCDRCLVLRRLAARRRRGSKDYGGRTPFETSIPEEVQR